MVSNGLLLDTTSNKKVSSLVIMHIRMENKIFHIKAQLHIVCGKREAKMLNILILTLNVHRKNKQMDE